MAVIDLIEGVAWVVVMFGIFYGALRFGVWLSEEEHNRIH